jgi:large conductance mechanosensitive channel
MLKGFRDFITRGNVIDLAVAVVIGAAFTAVINTFTAALIQPLVRVALGGSNADSLGGTVTVAGEVIDFGAMINAIITFLITAAVVYFLFVAPMNAYRNRSKQPTEAEAAAEEVVLLREIRDALQQQSGGLSAAQQQALRDRDPQG